QLVLYGENIIKDPVVAIRPDVPIGVCLDKLAGYAHAIGGLAYAAFKNVTHAQFTSDLLHIYGPSFVGEARIAPDHQKPLDTRKPSNNVLDHPVGQILLFRITT